MDPKSIASANSATFAQYKKRTLAVLEKVGAPTRTRTWNQQIKSLLLYQLSYGGKARCNEPPRANISRGGRGFYGRARGRSSRVGERVLEHPLGPAHVVPAGVERDDERDPEHQLRQPQQRRHEGVDPDDDAERRRLQHRRGLSRPRRRAALHLHPCPQEVREEEDQEVADEDGEGEP